MHPLWIFRFLPTSCLPFHKNRPRSNQRLPYPQASDPHVAIAELEPRDVHKLVHSTVDIGSGQFDYTSYIG